MTKAALNRALASFDSSARLMEQELKKLCENPEMFDVAQAIMDHLWGELATFCNYSHFVDHNGQNVDVLKALERVKNVLCTRFQKLTGRKYLPHIARVVRNERKSKS